jgi:hypothetical protein
LNQCDHAAGALYLFLLTVGDVQGLSYYSEAALGRQLKMNRVLVGTSRPHPGS